MKTRSKSIFNIFTLFALLISPIGSGAFTPAYAAPVTYNVTDCAKDNGGAGQLRTLMNAAVSGDTINIPACTITIEGAAGEDLNASGDLDFTKNLTITGAGAGSTIIDGGAIDRVFHITGTFIVAISGVTIRNGYASYYYGGGGIYNSGTLTVTNSTFSYNDGYSIYYGGGAVHNSGTLKVTNSTFSGNMATEGGGIYNHGMLTVTNSTFSGNSAFFENNGGAIFNGNFGATTVTNSIFSGNSAGFRGGAIYNQDGSLTVTNSTFNGNSTYGSGGGGGGGIFSNFALTMTNCTFNGNSAGFGGAIVNYDGSTTTVTNSAFSGNIATKGSGIYNSGTLTVTNSTFSGNSTGGGIFNYSGNRTINNTTTLKNTIVANNTGDNCFGAITAGTDSMSDDTSCGAATVKTLAQINLGSLADNGGSTQTFALLAGSSAIDAGDDAVCAATPVSNTSQNGITRPQGAHCDIGSYEKALIFADVPFSYWANSYIERLYNAGVTGGCSTFPLMYCPDAPVTRAQMAIFILRGMHGSSFVPPPATGTVFGDVPANAFAANFIEQLAAEGITGGCGGGNYCPDATVTRAQMAIFLLRGEHGSTFAPPPATGTVFTDVPAGSFAADFIEQLAAENITGGCGNGNYCPNATVTRAEMAVFLVRTFNIP